MLQAAKAAARATKLDCSEMEVATLGLPEEDGSSVETLVASGLTAEDTVVGALL